MKKFLLLAVCFAGLAIALSSCKAHEDCPAYGQVNVKIVARG